MATEGPCCAGVCLCERESHRILYLRGDGAEMIVKVLTRMGVAVGVCGAESISMQNHNMWRQSDDVTLLF